MSGGGSCLLQAACKRSPRVVDARRGGCTDSFTMSWDYLRSNPMLRPLTAAITSWTSAVNPLQLLTAGDLSWVQPSADYMAGLRMPDSDNQAYYGSVPSLRGHRRASGLGLSCCWCSYPRVRRGR
eukprot:3040430-Prymnesium_polylepis.1